MDAPQSQKDRSVRRPMTLAIQSLSVATASSLLLWTAGGGLDLPHPKFASAGTKLDKASKQSASGFSPEVQDKTVKLNYFSATWETVFKDVAAATGSQLIADRVPKGRFSRRDATEYTRHDAVRIINKEIEPHGFRLIEKGDFLIVLDLPSQRPRYQPITVTKDDNVEQVNDPNRSSPSPATASSPFERRIQAIAARDDAQAELAHDNVPHRAVKKPVRQVSHDDLPTESNRTAPRRVSTADGSAPARLADEPVSNGPVTRGLQVVFRPKHRSAVELSKQVYRTLKPRAQLVSHGPNGLPAFRISSAVAANQDDLKANRLATGGASFTIAIDEASDELLIVGTRAESDAMLKLLRTLDRPFDAEDPIQVTASTKYVCQIAHQLPAEIERLRAANQDDTRPATKPARDDAPAEPRGGRQLMPPALGDAIGTLKGEVTIESVDDLGVLILRGNEKDVEQVMKVIRELEKLSEATAPQVHLLYLKNVDAESLAELLTTVYDRLTKFPGRATQPRQSAAILPITKPNSLLIVAPEVDLQAILDLAEELDRPVDPLTEFQVFHLKTAIAAQVEELITKFYLERKNLGAKILVTSDGRSNAVIVRAQPRDLDEIAALIKKLDREFSESVSQIRIFALKSAVAADLSAVMNAAIQSVIAPPTSSSGGGGNQQGGLQGLNPGQVDEQFKIVKSTVLEWKLGDQLLKSGILADIRITPDSRANALIVSASEQSMTLIEQLIKQLDKPTTTVSEIKVFTLANADAELMVTQLNALFNGQTQTGGGNQQRPQPGLALAGADDASSSLVPLKFSVDKRTNSIVATGSADALKVVEAILLRLDESDLRARQTVVLRLQNSPAVQVATEINQFFTSQRDLTQNDPNLISSIEQLERDVVVVADTATNSLIISATPRYFEDIKKMVSKLDEPPRQVIIQALLVEVELSNTDEFGIELGFQDSLLFNRSALDAPVTISQSLVNPTNGAVVGTTQQVISQTGQPGFNFNNPTLPLGNNLKGVGSNPSTVASQSLSNFSLGRVNGDLGFGGLVLSAGSENINALLRALSAHRRIQILSRPQIRALDNQQAEIFSGQEIPVISGFTPGGVTGTNIPTVERKNAGIQLTCIPRVTSEGQVFMQVYAQRSQYRKEGVPLTTDAAGRTIQSPILDISRATTTISVQTGQTVVIGGLINTRDEAFTNKVPFLGDLPLIGAAFRYDSRSTRRVELLVFLTPRVIGGPMDEESIKDVEMGRLHYIESEAEDIHGPLRALPAPDQVFDENGAPWYGPGLSVPSGTGPALPSAPQLPPPPAPKTDPATPNSAIIRDSAVNPASASRLRYTEEDDQSSKVQQANAESFSPQRTVPRGQTKPPAKPASKNWGLRNR